PEPRPCHQDRAEIVAPDVGILIGRGKEAGQDRGDTGQQSVVGPPEGGRRETRRHERREESELVDGPADEVRQLAWQISEWVHEAALELLAECDIPESVPGIRVTV